MIGIGPGNVVAAVGVGLLAKTVMESTRLTESGVTSRLAKRERRTRIEIAIEMRHPTIPEMVPGTMERKWMDCHR